MRYGTITYQNNSLRFLTSTRLQETVVYTIGELGKEAEDELLLVVIVSLLETFLSKTKIISSLAFTQVRVKKVIVMVILWCYY